MRLLTILATAVLLAACVHDTDDFTLFVAESGASLTYYIGSDEKNAEEPDDPWDEIMNNYSVDATVRGLKNITPSPDDPWDEIKHNYGEEAFRKGSSKSHDDPWDTIGEKYGVGTASTGKSREDDPWDTISDSYSPESVHTGKSDEEDPWSRIDQLFPIESVHTGKTNDRYFLGFEKSTAVFVSLTYQESAADHARVTEVRGRVLKLEFADGVEQYVIDAPASWVEGTQLVTGFLEATSKKDRPFLGVRFWRTVEGQAWSPQARDLASELPVEWPSEYHASGASLLVSLSAGQKSEGDPWNRISELFPDESIHVVKNSEKDDDPWDTIRDNFSEESVHPVSGKTHDDPWTTITEKFGIETVHTGSGKAHDDPWTTITEKFGLETVHTGSGKAHDDPWTTITEKFGLETVHTGSGKAHDDPWDTIGNSFPLESTHTRKGKASSFMGELLVEMLFTSVGGDKRGEDNPWDVITDKFPLKLGKSTVVLTLKEVRGRIGRFELANGRSIFAVQIPAGWEPGLVLRGEAYLLDTEKMLPLIPRSGFASSGSPEVLGAVVWEVDRNLSLPKAN